MNANDKIAELNRYAYMDAQLRYDKAVRALNIAREEYALAAIRLQHAADYRASIYDLTTWIHPRG